MNLYLVDKNTGSSVEDLTSVPEIIPENHKLRFEGTFINCRPNGEIQNPGSVFRNGQAEAWVILVDIDNRYEVIVESTDLNDFKALYNKILYNLGFDFESSDFALGR